MKLLLFSQSLSSVLSHCIRDRCRLVHDDLTLHSRLHDSLFSYHLLLSLGFQLIGCCLDLLCLGESISCALPHLFHGHSSRSSHLSCWCWCCHWSGSSFSHLDNRSALNNCSRCRSWRCGLFGSYLLLGRRSGGGDRTSRLLKKQVVKRSLWPPVCSPPLRASKPGRKDPEECHSARTMALGPKQGRKCHAKSD